MIFKFLEHILDLVAAKAAVKLQASATNKAM